MSARSTLDVLNNHLYLREHGDIDDDIEHNYAEDAVLLTGYGVFHGRDSIRASANILDQQLGHSHYLYRTRLVHGPAAFLEWTAESDHMRVQDGADSYFIEDGVIKVQTIHYTLVAD